MNEPRIGLIDVGFLRAAGAAVSGQRTASLNPNAEAIVGWFHNPVTQQFPGQSFLRAYWYDGAFDPSHHDYAGQRVYFNAIAQTPGVQLRLGHIAERQNRFETPILQALERTALRMV